MARNSPLANTEHTAEALALLAQGETRTAIAKKFNVSRQTISNWEAQYAPTVSEALQKKRVVMAPLVAKYLESGFTTLIAHAEFGNDKAWFKSQNAHDLAVWSGTLFDKMAHILEQFRGLGVADEQR